MWISRKEYVELVHRRDEKTDKRDERDLQKVMKAFEDVTRQFQALRMFVYRSMQRMEGIEEEQEEKEEQQETAEVKTPQAMFPAPGGWK